MKRFVLALVISLFALTPIASAQNSRFPIEELLKVRRVGDAQVSPDGSRVAFTIGDVNYDANRVLTQIYVMPIGGGSSLDIRGPIGGAAVNGGAESAGGPNANSPVMSPSGGPTA